MNAPSQRKPVRAALNGLILGGLFFITGCYEGREPADLTIINGQDPASFDPALISGVEDFRVARALFEGLTRIDPRTAQAVPGLAESWSLSGDEKTYTFVLREGLKWSTGAPINSQDLYRSWLRFLDNKSVSPYRSLLDVIKRVDGVPAIHTPDDRSLVVELEQKTPYFLDLCAMATMAAAPVDLIEKAGPQWLKTKPLPCSGPYTLVDWRLNDRIRLKRNPNYWDAANTQSETVDLLVCGPNTAFNLYHSEAVDLIWDKSMIPTELTQALSDSPNYHAFPSLGIYFVRLNITRPPLDNIYVRKALALAIDKERLVQRVVLGQHVPATRFVPPGTDRYASGLAFISNIPKAKQALKEAGYGESQPFPSLEILFPSSGANSIFENMAVELRDQWKEHLGVELSLRRMEKQVFFANQKKLNYDISCSTWLGDYNDPTTFLDIMLSKSGNNRTGWKKADYDALLKEAARQNREQQRTHLLRKAEDLLIFDECPVIPLYYDSGFFMIDPGRIGGIYPNILATHPIRTIFRR